MRYLEKALLFAKNNYILALPLFLINVIASIAGNPSVGFLSRLTGSFWGMNSMSDFFDDPIALPGILLASGLVTIASILKTILSAAAVPGTYGMINSGLEGKKCDPFRDFLNELKKHFPKYIIYWIANAVLWGVLVLSFLLIAGISIASGGVKTILLVILGTLLIAGAIYVSVNLSLWFPSMVAGDLNVISALRNSFKLVKGNFWMIFGINILVSVLASLVSSVLSFLYSIPFIGKLITALPPTLSSFLLISFYLVFYKSSSTVQQ